MLLVVSLRGLVYGAVGHGSFRATPGVSGIGSGVACSQPKKLMPVVALVRRACDFSCLWNIYFWSINLFFCFWSNSWKPFSVLNNFLMMDLTLDTQEMRSLKWQGLSNQEISLSDPISYLSPYCIYIHIHTSKLHWKEPMESAELGEAFATSVWPSHVSHRLQLHMPLILFPPAPAAFDEQTNDTHLMNSYSTAYFPLVAQFVAPGLI